MKQRKKDGFLAYLIPALILTGILVFAVVHSLRIYIPQMREQGYYDELKKKSEFCCIHCDQSHHGFCDQVFYLQYIIND